jgi:prephenate dehydratase
MSTVSIIGVAGSYSHEAAVALLGTSQTFIECSNFSDVVQAILTKASECAVLPLRNKIVGDISEPVQLIRSCKLKVVTEVKIPIDHKLIGTAGGSIAATRTVRSHFEAIRQCRRFLRDNSMIRTICATDTASSVRTVVEMNDRSQAAIGSARAAEIYGAEIIGSGISDDENNWTVFGLIEISGEEDNA